MEDTVTEGIGTVTLAPFGHGGGAGGMILTVTITDWAPPSVAMAPPNDAADLCDPYLTTDFIGHCGPDVPLHGTLTVTVSGAVSRSVTFTSATCDEPSIVLGGPESDAPGGVDVMSVRLDEKEGGLDLVHAGAPDDQFSGPLTITLQQRYPSVGSYSGTLRWEHSALGQSTPAPDVSTVHVEGTFSCRPS